MALSAVIWDVGGTLVRRTRTLAESRNLALAQVGLQPEQLNPAAVERAIRLFQDAVPTWRTTVEERRGLHRLAEILLDGAPVARETVTEFARILQDYFDNYAVIPGVAALLAELREADVPQGVVSNWPPSLRGLLAHHGLGPYFDVMVVSGEEGIQKPDRRLFARALARMALQPSEAVYVGNSLEADILPARALGMQAVHFQPLVGEADAAGITDVAMLREQLFGLLGDARG